MKTLFIPAKSNLMLDEKKFFDLSKHFPKNLMIAYSIQFKEIAEKISKILSKTHEISKTAQILGCTNLKFPKESQAVLLIGSGKFHAVSLAVQTKKPVYLFEGNNLIEISKKEIEEFEKKQRGSYLKFLRSDKVGILISTKPGQNKLEKALKLRFKNKETYYFISNEINLKEFENFGLNSWVNTACPRLDMSSSQIVNISNL